MTLKDAQTAYILAREARIDMEARARFWQGNLVKELRQAEDVAALRLIQMLTNRLADAERNIPKPVAYRVI